MADLKGKLDQMDQDMVGIAYERLIPVTDRFREQIIEKGGAEDDVEQALVDLNPTDPSSVMAFLVKVHADANECPCRRHALQAFNTAGFGVFLEKVVLGGVAMPSLSIEKRDRGIFDHVAVAKPRA